MQSRDSMSLTDRESSLDESDCSLETVQSFARGTPRKRKRNAKCGGEKPAAKQSREEGKKGADTPNDSETAKRDNEVVTSGKQPQQASRPPRILGVQKARPRLHGFGVQKASKATQAARVLCAEHNENKPTATRATVCGGSWLCRAVTPCH